MESISTSHLDDEQLKTAVSLYRYVCWANALRMQFETSLANHQAELEYRLQVEQITFEPKLLPSEMCICLWFGILYNVIEGWPRLKLDVPRLTKLLRHRYKGKLRDFRNATFHPVDYDDTRIQDMVATGQESIVWAKEVTNEFKSFFESILIFPEK